MPRKQDQIRSGRAVKYREGLEAGGGLAYMAPNIRAVVADGRAVAQDDLVIVSMPADRQLTLPKIGTMRNGQALIVSRNPNAPPRDLTVIAHPDDLGRQVIEYLYDQITVPLPATFAIRRIDDPATGAPYWRIDGLSAPGGVVMNAASIGFQQLENATQPSSIVIAIPGTWVPWTTGLPVMAMPGLFSVPAGSQIEVLPAAAGNYRCCVYCSFAAEEFERGNLIEARVTWNGGPFPGGFAPILHNRMSAYDAGEDPAIQTMAFDAIIPLYLPALPLPGVLELEFTANGVGAIFIFDCSLSLLKG